MKFVFQGSQNLHIRVAISFEALIGFQCLLCEIIVHFMPLWPVYLDFMGTFQTHSSSLCLDSVINIRASCRVLHKNTMHHLLCSPVATADTRFYPEMELIKSSPHNKLPLWVISKFKIITII